MPCFTVLYEAFCTRCCCKDGIDWAETAEQAEKNFARRGWAQIDEHNMICPGCQIDIGITPMSGRDRLPIVSRELFDENDRKGTESAPH